jgi:hypothetical protein
MLVEHHFVHCVQAAERARDPPHGQVRESRQSTLDGRDIKAEVADLQWSHGQRTLPGRARTGNGQHRRLITQ